MPIIINDASISSVNAKLSMKDFFSKELTGNGGKGRGLLNESNDLFVNNGQAFTDWQYAVERSARNSALYAFSFNPQTTAWVRNSLYSRSSVHDYVPGKKAVDGYCTSRFLPVNVFSLPLFSFAPETVPDITLFKEESFTDIWDDGNAKIAAQFVPRDVLIESTEWTTTNASGNPIKTKNKGVFALSDLIVRIEVPSGSGSKLCVVGSNRGSRLILSNEKVYNIVIPCDENFYKNNDVGQWLLGVINGISNITVPGQQMKLKQKLTTFVHEAKIHDALENLSDITQEDFDNDIVTFTQWLIDEVKKINITQTNKGYDSAIVADFVERLDSAGQFARGKLLLANTLYDICSIIHKSGLDEERIIGKSLRLLLSDRLHRLDEANKAGKLAGIKGLDPNGTVRAKFQKDPAFSVAQKDIILSDSSLIIGSAGAGSGKSHTVFGRLKFMQELGIPMDEVAVFSFTNVAADNIKNRYPGVTSETLANMFHSIFNENFPEHVLAPPVTIAKAMLLLDGTEPLFLNHNRTVAYVWNYIARFAGILSDFDQKGFERIDLAKLFRDLNNLVSEDVDLAIEILSEIKLTSLEIEPVILHHFFLGNAPIVLPKKYANIKHFITDESQDISTFEYVILLEMVTERKASLLIVGDGSQTLYEFRNSDPRYLNALEKSQVFNNKTLSTNFRSNQEILDVANKFLQVIEANDVAKIQLKSNNFRKADVKSFEERVKLVNCWGSNTNKDWCLELSSQVKANKDVEKLIIDSFTNGKQLAVLAWTRDEVAAMEAAVLDVARRHGLNPSHASLIKEREKKFTLLSEALEMAKGDLVTCGTGSDHLAKVKRLLIDAKCSKIKSLKGQQRVRMEMNQELSKLSGDVGLLQSVAELRSGTLAWNDYQKILIQKVLRLEAEKNSVVDWLSGASSVGINPDDYDFISSTIHSAKGLEFDNVIISFNSKKSASKTQESLRLFFVGLTRAKEREIILSSGMDAKILINEGTNIGQLQDNPMNVAYALSYIDAMGQGQAPATSVGGDGDDGDDNTPW